MGSKKNVRTNLVYVKYIIKFDAYTRNFFRLKAGAARTEAVWDDEARCFFWGAWALGWADAVVAERESNVTCVVAGIT